MRITIRGKLIISFLFIVVLMIGLGVINLYTLQQSRNRIQYIDQDTVPSVAVVDSIGLNISDYRRYQL